jgi:hypothetical protein
MKRLIISVSWLANARAKFSLLLKHIHTVHTNTLENSKLSYKYVGIDCSSKYSKYVERLLINMSHFILTVVCSIKLLVQGYRNPVCIKFSQLISQRSISHS